MVTEGDDQLGCAFLDISTGELRASQFSGADRWNKLLLDIEHFSPTEVLFPEKLKERVQKLDIMISTEKACARKVNVTNFIDPNNQQLALIQQNHAPVAEPRHAEFPAAAWVGLAQGDSVADAEVDRCHR